MMPRGIIPLMIKSFMQYTGTEEMEELLVSEGVLFVQ
jgi:hypothetical protein